MRIGICEDDPKDLARLQGFLAKCRPNDQVLCFSDGTSLIDAVRSGAIFDLLFLDVYLPDVKGTELASTVRLNDGETFAFRQTLGELRQSLDARFIDVTRGVVVNVDFIERMGSKSCVLKDGREMLLSRASAKDIRKAYQDYLFSRMVDHMDR